MDCKAEIQTFSRDLSPSAIQTYIELYGIQALELAHLLRCIEHEASLRKEHQPHVLYQLIKNFFDAVKSEEPLHFHRELARFTLNKESDVKKDDPNLIELLAKEIAKAMSAIGRGIPYLDLLAQCEALDIFAKNNDHGHSVLNIFEIEKSDEMDALCVERKKFLPLQKYLAYIKRVGPEGKKAYEKTIKIYEKQSQFDKRFWFVTGASGKHFYNSPAFMQLAKIILRDRVLPHFKKCPALTKGVLETTLYPLFSTKMRVVSIGRERQAFTTDGRGIITVPCVDSALLHLIISGLEKFSSLTSQRVMRWLVKSGFANWLEKSDPRLIKIEGGYKYIAEAIGCKSIAQIAEVRSLLHALAYAKFLFPDGTRGNLITLREVEKYRNGESSKINIVLGDLLLPDYTHSLPKGNSRRLIPIPDLPPLVGSRVSHAAQGVLQLLILGEFSNRSDEFAERGSIEIPMEKWVELSVFAGIPRSSLNSIIEAWSTGNVFLKRDGNFYGFCDCYGQVEVFLKEQGNRRIAGSKSGKKSAKAKRELIERGFSKSKG